MVDGNEADLPTAVLKPSILASYPHTHTCLTPSVKGAASLCRRFAYPSEKYTRIQSATVALQTRGRWTRESHQTEEKTGLHAERRVGLGPLVLFKERSEN